MRLYRVFLLLLLVAEYFIAAEPQPTAKFEVASVRAMSRADATGMSVFGIQIGGPGTSTPESFTVTGGTFSALLRRAYEIKPYQLVGPDAIRSGLYNVKAKLPPETTREEFPEMLKAMVRERFHFSMHWEERETTAYSLEISKKGLKLRPDPLNAAETWMAESPPESKRKYLTTSPDKGEGREWKMASEPMAIVRMSLEEFLGSPVQDKTGLNGTYDGRFRFSLDADNSASAAPPLTSALAEFGLVLVPQKVRLKVLVVDSFDPVPAEN